MHEVVQVTLQPKETMHPAQKERSFRRRRGTVDLDDIGRPSELMPPANNKKKPAMDFLLRDSVHSRPGLHPFDPYGPAATVEHHRQRNDSANSSTTTNSTENDAAMAAALQMQFHQELKDQEEANIQKSIALALEMQQDEEESTIASCGDDAAAMSSTPSGKAWMLVERVLALMKEVDFELEQNPTADMLRFSAVATDDMVFLAERMFEFQEYFAKNGKSTKIDVGFHFTNAESLDRIKTDGLLSKVERDASGIISRNNGSKYGDGIYVANTPYAYQNFGDIGILCARLKGDTVQVERGQSFSADTGIARGGTDKETAILGSSYQCLPLLYFCSLADPTEGAYILSTFKSVQRVYDHQERLQRILDEFFSDGEPTPVFRTLPPPIEDVTDSQQNTPVNPGMDSVGILHIVPGSRQNFTYTAPEELSFLGPASVEVESSGLVCSLCLGSRSPSMLCMEVCGHTFHRSCIQSTLAHGNRCPICHVILMEVQGQMPSASMETVVVAEDCDGFPGSGTIVINYDVPEGIQKVFHPSPGALYPATKRRAFVPNTIEGQLLVERLANAFHKGLTFRIGKSLTSGRDNVVTWGSIPHKTTHGNGEYGYPDSKYLDQCNEELDALGVPMAEV